MSITVTSSSHRKIALGYEMELTARTPRLRRALEDQRQFRLDQLAELAMEERASGRHSMSEYVEDLDASANSARSEVSTVIAAAARRALGDIESALAKIRSGGYGSCERCGSPIGIQRLDALPQAAFCMGCQRHAEVRSAVR